MIVRHSETRSHEPSVRFYRTIAFTFLILTILLLGAVVFITSKKATITVISKEDSKSINLNVGVSATSSGDVIKGVVTSVVFNKAEKYFPTGSKSVIGIAEGEVVIYNKSDTEQILVKTTRLLNPNGILFRLSDRVVVPADGQVIAHVYADKEGVDSEIGPSQFIIPGLNTDRQKMIYAESKSKMVGGLRSVGFLSESDLDNAKIDYVGKVKKAAIDSLNGPEWDGLGKLATVISQDIKSDRELGKEVDSFTLDGVSTVVVVGYDQVALKNLIAKEMSDKIDVGAERVLSVSGDPQPSISSYDLGAHIAQLSVRQEALVTIDPDITDLSPNNLIGKSKDEIERFVLGLDHVASVDVKFSPSWIRKSPTVPDHVKVIIKNIQ